MESKHSARRYKINEKQKRKRRFNLRSLLISDYPIQTRFTNDNEYLNFLNTIKDKSITDFNVELSAEKGILTLSTCGNDNKKRYNSFKNTRSDL